MQNPLVSIVVPVYNSERYLYRCMESILNQTYKNIEILLIDDGSSDISFDICFEYAKRDKRIRFIHKENGGLSESRNLGIILSLGEYILFVDSDDYIDKRLCELAVEQAQKENCGVVLWACTRYLGNKIIEVPFFDDEGAVFTGHDIQRMQRMMVGLKGYELACYKNPDIITSACLKLYKASIIKENGLCFANTEISGTEDCLFNLHYFGLISKAVYINRCLYHFGENKKFSYTFRYKNNLITKWQNSCGLIERYLEDKGLSQEFHDALDCRMALSLTGVCLAVQSKENPKRLIKKISEFKNLVKDMNNRKAYNRLNTKNLPLIWKMFFACAKHQLILLSYIILCIMKKSI